MDVNRSQSSDPELSDEQPDEGATAQAPSNTREISQELLHLVIEENRISFPRTPLQVKSIIL